MKSARHCPLLYPALAFLLWLGLSPGLAQAQEPSLLRQARAQVAAGRFDRAGELYRRLLQAQPDNALALGELADALEAAGRWREAVPVLSHLLELQPDDVARLFQLGRFLSWVPERRPDSYALLEQAVRAQPENLEYRLAYAEVLSWDPHRRVQALAEYEQILSHHPTSPEAQSGLAQLLSWSGKLARAETMYDQLIARDPQYRPALVGKGEVLAWSGRNLEAGEFLDRATPPGVDSRWLLARATASYGIGRRDQAARRLATLFSSEPDNPYAQALQQAIDNWRQPHIDFGFSLMRGSGDPATSEVEFNRPFARLHFPVNAWSRAEVSYVPTNYFNQTSRRREDLLGVGWEGQPHDNFRFQARLQAARHASGPGDFTGSVQFGWLVNDRVQMDFGFTRARVLDSVQAAAGVVVNGVLIGRARSNLANVQLRYLAPRKRVDLYLRHSIGSVTGIGFDSNRRVGLGAGTGKTFRLPREQYLRLGYAFTFFGFDRDLGAFPAPTPSRTTGGYFSPAKFFNNAGEINLTGKLARRWSYSIGGYLGVQQAETLSASLGQRKLSSYAQTTQSLRLTRHLSLTASYEYVNVAGAFQRNTFSFGFRIYLDR
ncbi:MAG: tetratricopeptide repeat protein [Candidatus Acidiferrales bacterium]